MKVVPLQNNPRVVDNDRGVIVVNYNGRQIRGWSYQSDVERRTKMMYAREYVEGWCDGRDYNAQPISIVCDPHFWDMRGICLKCGVVKPD